MTRAFQIVVAGGGIGGLAAALVLGRQGHHVQVYEQSEQFGEIGAGIQLGPNIFRMFDLLGLTDAVSRVAFFPSGLRMNDVLSGEQVVRAPMGEAVKAAYGYPYGVIYRADLHELLLTACRAVPGIALHTSAQVVGYEVAKAPSGEVKAQLADGRTASADLLLGADGLWSRIRSQMLGDGKPRVSGHIAYRAVLPRAEVPAQWWSDDVVLWGGEKTHLVHYPLRRGELFNLVAVFHSDRHDEGWNTFGDVAELNERFARACAPVQGLLGKINTWKMWVLCDREPVKHWVDGPVALLGDAAHPMLQYLAQGAGQAIEDAVVLGEALKRFEPCTALRAYNQARYLRTGRVQLTARFYGDIYHAAGVARELRNHMFRSGVESAGFAGLKWMYEGIRLDDQLFAGFEPHAAA